MLDTELPQKGRYLQLARWLVRLAGENEKPEGERLRRSTASRRAPRWSRRSSRARRSTPEYEQDQITGYLWRLRSPLGVTHPLVLATLGRERPEDLAARWVAATRLGDVEARRRLAAGGKAAIAASDDPLLRFVATVEPVARGLRRRYDDEIESVEVAAGTRISAARFELGGKEIYPDATGSLRFTFGKPLGYEEGGQQVPWHTTFAGMFERSAARQGPKEDKQNPWALTPALTAAREKLDLAGPVNFATLDSTGGNSGSPVVDRQIRFVESALSTATSTRWRTTSNTPRTAAARCWWTPGRSSRCCARSTRPPTWPTRSPQQRRDKPAQAWAEQDKIRPCEAIS